MKTRNNKAFTLVELLVVLGVIAILTAILLPVFAKAKGKAANVTCLNNLKQLGIATRLYAEDNNSLLPSVEALPSNPVNPQKPLARICDVLGPYAWRVAGTNVGAGSVFRCPKDKDFFFEVEGSSYQWNTVLNGRRIDLGENRRAIEVVVSNGVTVWQTNADLSHTIDSTPLLVDYDEFHPRPPKPGRNVVYMDGHVAGFEP